MQKKILIFIILLSLLFCGTEKKDNNRDLLLFLLLTAEPSFPAGPYSKYLYTVNRGSSDIYAYKVEVNTGGLVQINTVKTDRNPSSLVVNFAGSKTDSDGLFAYVSNQGANSISGYKINKADGKIDPISGNPNNTVVASNVGTQPSSLAFDPTGYYLAVSNSGSDN
ncbi:MAG: lactonase family protein, partial [Leptospiraceae bacterium]|nr:lactonase family protein [Leptospiraceae bacterium]